jgi:hypothetical protein
MGQRTATKEKKIMIVTNNRKKNTERLKYELEANRVCDRVDISTVNPRKLLEELILKKGFAEYDYRMYILDDSIEGDYYSLAENLKHNFPTAHLVLLSARGKPKTVDDMKSNFFHYYYRKGMSIEWCEELLNKEKARQNNNKINPWKGLPEDYRLDRVLLNHAIKAERLGFNINYIKKPIKSYRFATKKIQNILVTGLYQHRVKYYPTPQEEMKAKSKKAFEKIVPTDSSSNRNILQRIRGLSFLNIATDLNDLRSRLEMYGKDITEKEHAAAIVKRLRMYENETKREVVKIQELIRAFEDSFPSIAEDPAAFEVEDTTSTTTNADESKKSKRNDNN